VIYTTENRTREVGIRKVFGAGKTSLTYLLSIEFVKLMLWAILFAIPACFLLLDDLLSSVQYYSVRINGWDIFSGIVITFCLAIITIASQTWRAASKNPVDILRCE
jgi:putative ABC transport system permease protein